ncbi:MAG TPA: hypothetical protein VKX40_05240 [Aequorivita sp.]|nr:hypothetical protein [Aequorivita sp.]
MKAVYFKFKEHPGDFFRNTDIIILPNPQLDLENFLIQFLRHYQSDERVAYLDDLYKLLNNDFYNEDNKNEFTKLIGNKTKTEIKEEIQLVENNLKNEAYTNFYTLILKQKIEIIKDGKEQ